jgi:molybdenum cofactor biosynthesis enzyme MoaA
MCPRGGVAGLKNASKGLMSFELFQKIINKFINERVAIEELIIGNWGEPLLNPDLSRMIRYFRQVEKRVWPSRKIPIWVSSNLNYLQDPFVLLSSGLDDLNISISGMTQKVYAKNHRGGDIKKVLMNVLRLVEAREQLKLERVQLRIFFLEFIYNKKDMETAKKFCKTYGLEFDSYRAFVGTVEENLKLAKNKGKLSSIYEQYIDLDSEKRQAKSGNQEVPCLLRERYVTVNFDGQLYRCCLTFDEKTLLGQFLKHKIKNIPCIKTNICQICLQQPFYNYQFVHAYKHGQPRFDSKPES